ncbi:hypothetical protein HZC30_06280 [Candidatus Woesearchaeota archaeon]|nr:hypothetical protein [Candidatus Woesearchaeota archaeon]
MTEIASFWLKEMVVLGQGALNQARKLKGRQGRCLCLWSEKTGFVRVFPVPPGYVHDWEIINVEVRKPNDDGRENTFVINQYEEEFDNLSKRIYAQKEITKKGTKKNKELKRPEKIALLENISKSTFSQIRDNNKSFGLIKPTNMKFLLMRKKEISEAQTTLAEQEYDIMNPDDFAFTPYLQYDCVGPCSSKHPHQQQIVSWEAYQFMKQNPNSEEHCMRLKDNYGIEKENWLHYLLIGNLKHKPYTYVIVKLIRFKIEEENVPE